MLATINSILVPLELSFDEIEWFDGILYLLIDLAIDLVFLIDMILMFMTSFRNKFGEEVKDQEKIIIHYVKKTRFFFDFFSLLGTIIFTSWMPSMKIFKFFKIVRILRVKSFIQHLNINTEVKTSLKIFKITFYTMISMHVYACVWYLVVKDGKNEYDIDGKLLKWIMPMEYFNVRNSSLLDDMSNI